MRIFICHELYPPKITRRRRERKEIDVTPEIVRLLDSLAEIEQSPSEDFYQSRVHVIEVGMGSNTGKQIAEYNRMYH